MYVCTYALTYTPLPLPLPLLRPLLRPPLRPLRPLLRQPQTLRLVHTRRRRVRGCTRVRREIWKVPVEVDARNCGGVVVLRVLRVLWVRGCTRLVLWLWLWLLLLLWGAGRRARVLEVDLLVGAWGEGERVAVRRDIYSRRAPVCGSRGGCGERRARQTGGARDFWRGVKCGIESGLARVGLGWVYCVLDSEASQVCVWGGVYREVMLYEGTLAGISIVGSQTHLEIMGTTSWFIRHSRPQTLDRHPAGNVWGNSGCMYARYVLTTCCYTLRPDRCMPSNFPSNMTISFSFTRPRVREAIPHSLTHVLQHPTTLIHTLPPPIIYTVFPLSSTQFSFHHPSHHPSHFLFLTPKLLFFPLLLPFLLLPLTTISTLQNSETQPSFASPAPTPIPSTTASPNEAPSRLATVPSITTRI